ncbi:3-deoxy-D-manno-octulosonate 8-phosphate phosphatase KdsC [bioreactor metagenome]|uniref:3-deoxy-D-manno-octulosonate 8-phosphate phosphatase KdsC n=1 Tax=bioreactor metagenome TaxID=1076179 RepID=A0A645IU95_9ZZZZ
MDVDGTLTDKGVFYSTEGLALKRFSVHDGLGISLLNQNKIASAIISSDESEIPLQRAKKLDIPHIIVAARRKSVEITQLLLSLDISFKEVAYIGDDVNDIEIMKMCGFSACPSDAVEEVKKIVDFISDFPGGNGAVRQLCEMILLAKGKPITLTY